MPEARISFNALVNLLGRYSYRYSSETALHQVLAQLLEQNGFEFQREFVLDARNRADFWIDGIVIEIKVDGALSDALRQVGRYINLPQVKGVILAGTPRWAGQPLEDKPAWQDKPFQMVRLGRQFL